MAFFGFDTSLPPGTRKGLGIGQPAGAAVGELDFDDSFAAPSNRLDDSKDAANLDTFGASLEPAPVVGDFDFFGQTAQLAKALEMERLDSKPTAKPVLSYRSENQPNAGYRAPGLVGNAVPQAKMKSLVGASKPFKTGYEQYSIPDLVADKELWGTSSPKPRMAPPGVAASQSPAPNPAGPAASSGRKVFSLDEIEGNLHSAAVAVPLAAAQMGVHPAALLNQHHLVHPTHHGMSPQPLQPLPMSDSRAFAAGPGQPLSYPDGRSFPAGPIPGPPFNEARAFPPGFQPGPMAPPQAIGHAYPFPDSRPFPPTVTSANVTPQPQLARPATADAGSLPQDSEKRKRRINKIQMMSKDNGLMTPHDKSYINRIQLQQLVAAVGGTEKNAPENTFLEDFYYQVYSLLSTGKSAAPAGQAYSTQPSSRYGFGRGSNGHTDSHIQRMQQQVARAIEAAKTRPKMTQLAIEGSLGTISFSNSKTPKPQLKVRSTKPGSDSRPKSSGLAKPANGAHYGVAKGTAEGPIKYRRILQDLERMYMLLLAIEDHKRKTPPSLHPGASAEMVEAHSKWTAESDEFNSQLWSCSRVRDSPEGGLQPFIAMLCHTKGKKMVQRIFQHADNDLRLTILTLVVLNLSSLPTILHFHTPASQKDHVVPFMAYVIPPIFGQISDCSLDTISSLLETSIAFNIPKAVATRHGKEIFTMLVSRAELLHEAAGSDGQPTSDASRARYRDIFNHFFSALEPGLPLLFATMSKAELDDDLHAWQFLAALGVACDQQQQQQERLVLGVKDHVMETVSFCRHPETSVEMRNKTLQKVNLFMKPLGLDVEHLG